MTSQFSDYPVISLRQPDRICRGNGENSPNFGTCADCVRDFLSPESKTMDSLQIIAWLIMDCKGKRAYINAWKLCSN